VFFNFRRADDKSTVSLAAIFGGLRDTAALKIGGGVWLSIVSEKKELGFIGRRCQWLS
jgi:hypothetical protein